MIPAGPHNRTFGELGWDSKKAIVNIRDADSTDRKFLESMFVEAALWDPSMPRQPLEALLLVPRLSRYVGDWGRPSDVALIADAGDECLGAAWYRFFSSTEPGYGFVDESIPELGIAVLPRSRGQSTGTALLKALMERARAARCSGLSLSVAATNPARHLYERHGFVKVGEVGSSWTMVVRFSS